MPFRMRLDNFGLTCLIGVAIVSPEISNDLAGKKYESDRLQSGIALSYKKETIEMKVPVQ